MGKPKDPQTHSTFPAQEGLEQPVEALLGPTAQHLEVGYLGAAKAFWG